LKRCDTIYQSMFCDPGRGLFHCFFRFGWVKRRRTLLF
jgi:hypothetical protein